MARKRRTKAEIARDFELRRERRNEEGKRKTKILRMERESKEMIDRHELQVGALCRFIRYMSNGCGDCPFGDPEHDRCGISCSSDRDVAIELAHQKMNVMEKGI